MKNALIIPLAASFLWSMASPGTAESCGDAVTPACIVSEIRSISGGETDHFQESRVNSWLAIAQLAADDPSGAVETMKTVKLEALQREFQITQAHYDIRKGNSADALEQLQRIYRQLNESGELMDRLRATGHILAIAEETANAGAPEEAHALLTELADARNHIPMNGGVMGLMIQVAETMDAIGYEKEAATLLSDTYQMVLDEEINVSPQLMLTYFELWAGLDEDAARASADEMLEGLDAIGPSTFEAALRIGLVSGAGDDASDREALIANAGTALSEAPERAAALGLVPQLARSMAESGQVSDAAQLMADAEAEAFSLSDPIEQIIALSVIAEGLVDLELQVEAFDLLERMKTSAETGWKGHPDAIFSFIPIQLARLGKTDEAFAMATAAGNEAGDMALMTISQNLMKAGDFKQALRFAREIESELGSMALASIALEVSEESE